MIFACLLLVWSNFSIQIIYNYIVCCIKSVVLMIFNLTELKVLYLYQKDIININNIIYTK